MSTKTKLSLKAIELDNKVYAEDKIIENNLSYPLANSMHWHDFYELEIILNGSGKLFCNNKIYPLKPGLICFITPMDLHQYSLTTSMENICIQFTDKSIDKEILALFNDLKENVIYINEKQIKKIVTLFELLKENDITGTTGKMYNSKILEAILLLLKNDFKTTSASYSRTPLSMQKALAYINSHFRENPKMADVAKMLFLNEHYFCTLFKENVGESYKDYLRKLKLNYAANQIQNTNLSFTQISLDSGYPSQSNFNRDFKKFFGISPGSMREKG